VFEEIRPIKLGYEPHAGDDIADRDVRRALPAVLFAHDVIGVCALRTQTLVQPQKRRRRGRIFIAQSLDELNRKRSRKR
jgi:hypothetical protein